MGPLERRDTAESHGRHQEQSESLERQYNPEYDDQIYDVGAMGVADGFRPENDGCNHEHIASTSSPVSSTPRQFSPPPRPSSATKPKNARNSLTLQHDGDAALSSPFDTGPNSPESSTGMHTRSDSIDTPIIIPEGQYQGPTQPSHHYFSQSQHDRPSSIATTSTFPLQPPDRPYNGPSGPSHPYSIYPQNTIPESEDGQDSIPIQSIPVGFTGLGTHAYQRRLGPDGEEAADMVGPDGHTEQLPPYTRYADEVYMRKIGEASSLHADGDLGTRVATRAVEQERPLAQTTSPSVARDVEEPVDPFEVTSEKPPEKRWKQVLKKKLWGIIPVWAVLLSLFVVLASMMIGLCVGLLIGRQHPNKGTSQAEPSVVIQSTIQIPVGGNYPVTVTETVAAKPLSTQPPNLPALPTGTYEVMLSDVEESSKQCLKRDAQQPAWGCDMPSTKFVMSVTKILGSPNNATNQYRLVLSSDKADGYSYGSQPPTLGVPQELDLVEDVEDPELGLAWYSQVSYNKLVILPEVALEPTTQSKSSRLWRRDSDYASGYAAWQSKEVLVSGDIAWFCFWNGTLLQAYIYPNASSQPDRASMIAGRREVAAPTEAYTIPLMLTASVVDGPTSILPSWSVPVTSTLPPPMQTTGVKYAPYPKAIKLEERRTRRLESDQYDSPYCIKMQMGYWPLSTPTPVVNSTGQAVVVYLDEQKEAVVKRWEGPGRNVGGKWFSGGEGDDLERRAEDAEQECTCMWLV